MNYVLRNNAIHAVSCGGESSPVISGKFHLSSRLSALTLASK